MIYKHKVFELPIYLGLSALYIIPKFVISPFLYLFRKLGFQSSIPKKLDATINKMFLPLTEKPDSNEQMDIQSKIQIGDTLPPIELKFLDGSTKRLNNYSQKSLLMIFVRGSWCSYSRLHMADIMSNIDKFHNAGIALLAITAYKDQEWWNSNGINIPFCIDEAGEVFEAFGIQIDSWVEYAWSRTLPHESVFLFNDNGELVFNDVRKVSGILPGQRFLGSSTLLKKAQNLI